jgi:hypothetical protein
MVCGNFILTEICKPCLFLSLFEFAQLSIPYRLAHFQKTSIREKAREKRPAKKYRVLKPLRFQDPVLVDGTGLEDLCFENMR